MSPKTFCCLFGLVAIMCIITPTTAHPAYEEKSLDDDALPELDPAEVEGLQNLNRQRRVTCDVLSAQAFGVNLGDAPCALHCLQLGKKGGHCNAGVCVCRK